jgi:dTDP-4-amino-4,6-dideoxygalactose transaminase
MGRKKGPEALSARAYQADIEWATNAGAWSQPTALASVIEHAKLTGYRPERLCYLPYNERMNDVRGRALLGQIEQLEDAARAAAASAARLRAALLKLEREQQVDVI